VKKVVGWGWAFPFPGGSLGCSAASSMPSRNLGREVPSSWRSPLAKHEGHMRVLLAEDDRTVGAFLEEGLGQEGFVVDWARDGDKAVEFAMADAYDLIVLDFMLPKRDGLQVAIDIRRSGQQTPILMLTARDSAEDIRRSRAAGIDDHMGKPFRFDELLERIQALLSSG
jgi:two-component system, OmpR family, copper resistance phosphate regulon response regulator CusR